MGRGKSKNPQANKAGEFQAVQRMRVPKAHLRASYKLHVIAAIRRNDDIDKYNLYDMALREVQEEDAAGVLS